jgi:hypothetical protein
MEPSVQLKPQVVTVFSSTNRSDDSLLCSTCLGINEENTRYIFGTGKLADMMAYPHHSSLFDLRESTRNGCVLCKLFFDSFPWDDLELSQQQIDNLIDNSRYTPEPLADGMGPERSKVDIMNPETLVEEITFDDDDNTCQNRVPGCYRLVTSKEGVTGFPENAEYQIGTIRLRPKEKNDRGMLFISRDASKPFTELNMVMSGRQIPGIGPEEMTSILSVSVDTGKVPLFLYQLFIASHP